MKHLKIGDTYKLDLRVYNEYLNLPIILDETVTVAGVILDTYNNTVADVNVELHDQLVKPGWIIVTVPATETSEWTPFHARLRIKTIRQDDIVLSMYDIEFIVEI